MCLFFFLLTCRVLFPFLILKEEKEKHDQKKIAFIFS